MTTYRTGNAIGSADPRDLYDNAENLDELVNSQDKAEHPDRLGVPRKTWHGMEGEFNADQTRRESEFVDAQADKQQRFNLLLANSGYEYLADYAAGIEVTEYNQVLRDPAGELWRVSAATDLPYTTDGTGLPEGGAFVAVGDADIRNDLAAGVGAGKGGLLVSGAVIYVDTIADLLSLDTSGLVDGQQVQVREYHTGTGTGGGVFYYDPDSTEVIDGGIVHGSVEGPGRFILKGGQHVTPHNFGCEDLTVIDMARFRAFNEACVAKFHHYDFELSGDFTVSETLLFRGLTDRQINCNLTIRANAGFDTVVQFEDCNLSVFTGKVTALGVGGNSPSPSDNAKGIRVVSSPRVIFQSLHTNANRLMGIEFTNSNMARCDQMEIRNVGRYPGGGRALAVQATDFSNTGSSTSFEQRTQITLASNAGLDDLVPGLSFVRLKEGDQPYQVKEVSTDPDAPSISVYPLVPVEEHIPGPVDLCYGVGFYVTTNNNAKNSYGNISSTRCGIGMWVNGPSAPVIGSYTGQFCGIQIALGGPTQTTAYSGAVFTNAYFEATSVSDVLQVNQVPAFSNGTTIMGITATLLERMHTLGARGRSSPYFPINLTLGNSLIPAESFIKHDAAPEGSYGVSNSRMHTQVISVSTRGNMSVVLQCDKDFLRLKGNKPVVFIVTGSGPNGAFTNSDFGVEAEDGFTINGQPGKINFPDQSQAMEFTAILDRTGTNWLLFYKPLGIPVVPPAP